MIHERQDESHIHYQRMMACLLTIRAKFIRENLDLILGQMGISDTKNEESLWDRLHKLPAFEKDRQVL